MFSPSFPIGRMAELTGMLESSSKNNPGKDSLSLFGFETETMHNDSELICRHVYKWEDFEQRVVDEKLSFLRSHLDLEGNKEGLPIGKGQLYKFMDLLSNVNEEDIKIARFAYMLGRMQPSKKYLMQTFDEFSTHMYKWYKNEQDRRELYTAINLLVYYLRNDKEE